MSEDGRFTKGRGAPIGNQNAKRAQKWREALARALSRKAGTVDQGLDKIADGVVGLACDGEQWAIIEIGNRLDGKPAQAIEVSGDEDRPLMLGVVKLVRPD
jgi:hypothetical protein